MRIVQLLPELNEGGVERGVVELSREYVKKGIESFVISDGGKLVEQLEKEGSKHIKYDVCSKNIFSVIFRVYGLRKILKEINPDIIHVRSRVPAWLAYFANKSLKIPVASTVHGFNSVGFYSKIMTKSNHVICVSNSIKDYIQKHYSVSDDKTSVISRGIDLDVFNPDNIDKKFQKKFMAQYDLDNKFIVSSVGRITQLKDYETFIAAVSKVKKNVPNVTGLIAGGVREDKKNYFESLKQLSKKLDIQDQIIFVGSQNKIAEIYDISDVVVSSSKKPESFGRAVAEALAVNTPVIATNHGGVKDIIVENENGFFFESGDSEKLSKLIVNANELEFDGYGYISNKFSLENMVDKTIATYKKVLN